jgi:hypothetical protein
MLTGFGDGAGGPTPGCLCRPWASEGSLIFTSATLQLPTAWSEQRTGPELVVQAAAFGALCEPGAVA